MNETEFFLRTNKKPGHLENTGSALRNTGKFLAGCYPDFGYVRFFGRMSPFLSKTGHYPENIMNNIEYRPIGVIHSPFRKPEGTPIQPPFAAGTEAIVEIFPEYARGLEDIGGFSHVILLYHCHLAKKFALRVKPFLDDAFHGVFATRAPARPNPIGLSVVRLAGMEERGLRIQNADIVDGSPLLDIKPYVPQFDMPEAVSTGWFETVTDKSGVSQDDGRFAK